MRNTLSRWAKGNFYGLKKRRHRMSKEFTAIIEKRGEWFIGYVEEISGVNTQGKTLKEIRENLKEALKLIIEANRSLIHCAKACRN
jgi:predicted RNase H-like HicB family nuclease